MAIEQTSESTDQTRDDANPEHWQREHFIPVRRSELEKLLARHPDLSARESEAFQRFAHMLSAVMHLQSRDHLEQLKDGYAAFNPDADTRSLLEHTPEEVAKLGPQVFDLIVKLLKQANFALLDQDDLEEAAGASSAWGVRLHVDFDVFERLEVYARGDIIGQRELGHWLFFWKKSEVDVDIYQRLVLIFKLRDHPRIDPDADTETIYIKIFKNIPKQDVDMLLPGTRVRMTLLDQGKIFLPTLSGIVLSIVKMMKALFIFSMSTIFGFLAFLGLLGGTIGYGVKSFFGYLRTKDKYQLTLTRSLYYQNLDNNAGVLFRLVVEAEEQEAREALLGYFLLWQASKDTRRGITLKQLDQQAESLLAAIIDTDVDFEVCDAVLKLKRYGLAVENGEYYRAVPIDEACQRLQAHWNEAL